MTSTQLSRAFAEIKDVSVFEVGRMIGGKVQYNIEAGFFENTCAIRLSYALNKAGVNIQSSDGAVSSGKDGKWYLYKVNDVEKVVKNFPEEYLQEKKYQIFPGTPG